ncbi:MAG TPA: FAD-binding oxidoreductase, partial [Thermoanaerobaculia bacterium]|nr:FAD-binding oxidoreductase [Thermoanaerobaculia bacterium]
STGRANTATREEAIGWGYRRATFAEVAERAPLLRPEGLAHVLVDETTMDVDVEALHRGFLRLHKQAGGELVCRARLETAQRRGGVWHLETTAGSFAAPIVANAAGAWADRVAAAFGLAPLGLQPKRRSAAIVAGPAGVDVRGWLQVGDLRETFYLKPTGGKLMLCPVDADPCEPHDAYADDMRLAEAVEAMQRHVRLEVTRLERTWGGLRTFAPDSNPVIGLDPRAEGFFWSAGQGGYGIQTSAAWSEAAAALLLGDPMPAHVAELGIMARDIAPDRLL